MAIDWTKIFKKYKGLWVALKDDEKTVISSGKTARVAYSKAKEKGYENPIITRMPRNLHMVVGSNL
ncbi:hypothetical protein HY945_00515 [Candidatus Gottesmanbacteria bacterium]|nr:hypothetical protein [Candidatus Gottesmanbacteria bacterium]